MIKLRIWDYSSDDPWDLELKKPNYIIRTLWSLVNLEKIQFTSPNSESLSTYHADISRLKPIKVLDHPCCLNGEIVDALLILNTKPMIAVDLNSLPHYLREGLDENDKKDILDILENEIMGLFEDESNNSSLIKNLYESINIEVTPLKAFPKTIYKEPSYYYEHFNINFEIFTKKIKDYDYWKEYNLYYKIKLSESEFLIHLWHKGSGSTWGKIYSYETKKYIDNKILTDMIIELIQYNLWKTS